MKEPPLSSWEQPPRFISFHPHPKSHPLPSPTTIANPANHPPPQNTQSRLLGGEFWGRGQVLDQGREDVHAFEEDCFLDVLVVLVEEHGRLAAVGA